MMWERFTEHARRAVFSAQQEAGRLGTSDIGDEHLLLGLVCDDSGVAARILGRLGVDLGRIRSEVERQVTRGGGPRGQDMQLTQRAKRAIDLAYDEARRLNDNYIGTEHVLLALIRESDGLAGRVLAQSGVRTEAARAEVAALRGQPDAPVQEPTAVASDILLTLNRLTGRSLLSMADLSSAEVAGLLDLADQLRAARARQERPVDYRGHRSLACLFEKPSLRTRTSFELGMQELGGLVLTLGPDEVGLGRREAPRDVARVLDRMVHVVMARVFEHATLVEMRDNCGIPVVNGLSDLEHPCQCLADLLTLRDRRSTLDRATLAWVGDGNNVLHSLLLGAALTGVNLRAACPPGYEPSADIVAAARQLASRPDQLTLCSDPREAVAGADAVYTDTWTSMGQEAESERRRQAFQGYRVNGGLMALAGPEAVFMHCLPAHRGEEVTDEVLDGPQSVVYDQAENRLHAQKAVLAALLGPPQIP